MAHFTGNRQRSDPYKNFKFRLRWEGRHVAGASSASGLDSPGRTITLERGRTHDAGFEAWARKVSRLAGAADLRQDIAIDVYDEVGRLVVAYEIRGAWVSEYQAVPDLDAQANAVVIQQITLEHGGLERNSTSA